ncbi:hypothetical protein A4H97_28605 [Niastella yeongjuensis]|uniref:DUF3298 domain-containing protein n=1 Tax=Niastella yeongjuensis TaxID=354355 RepID=A0A1V9ETR9_9BACT|nr:DUF3298 and DUF4163 domain-containing protein [Niastella yeongjuensis]OQP49304.1 hypothetical protein A4H97_28605 [Niastella yeongjuensis]SEP43127.1 Protein of unknown function [Niastella yeongjuensis]
MKHIYILLLILGCVTVTRAQTGKQAPVVTRYYYLTGTIDKYPVTLHLYRFNENFSGYYYYNSTEEAIDITGTLGKDRFLKLTHNNNEGQEIEVLSGSFKDSSFSGTWAYKGKLLPFRAALKKDSSGLNFDYVYVFGEKKLPKEEYGRTELAYTASSIWPVATSTHPATNLIKQVIYAAFGEKPSQEDIGKVLIRQKNAALNTARKEDDPVTYDEANTVQVAYRNDKLLTISHFNYADGGGAHGNYGTGYINIDLIHNRKLALSDVLDTLSCAKTLRVLLEKKFRAAYEVKPTEKLSDYLFDNEISPTENFMLTSRGIGFQYNPYAIGSYAMGEIRLYIPFKELAGCLKPEFKKLVGMQ